MFQDKEPEATDAVAATPQTERDEVQPHDSRVVRAAIHPAIGIARVGNSEKEFYIGPEVTEPQPQPPGFYKDSKGALKREAACFRIYGYNAIGEVVSELTADNANITWTVHVANKKSAWYQFQLALDIPEAAPDSPLKTDPSALRNSLPVEIDGVCGFGHKVKFVGHKMRICAHDLIPTARLL